MKCYKCNYANRSDAVYCQQCGAPMRQRPKKVLVLLRRSPSLALRRQVAGYYVGYALCVLIGGGVLAAGAFLLFLVLCDWLGVTDPCRQLRRLVGACDVRDKCVVNLCCSIESRII